MNHKELFNQDLAGWKIANAYFLELAHGLMGFFPAIFNDEQKEMFLCLEKPLIEDVCKHLPPRRCKINEIQVLVNETKGLAFTLDRIKEELYSDKENKDTHIRVLTRQEFNRLTAKPRAKPFKWAPGLIGNDMNHEEFMETIQEALKKAS